MIEREMIMGALANLTFLVVIVVSIPVGSAQAQTRKEIYELQERCGKRAEQIFEKDFPVTERKGLEQYENHYNIRLNRCFILEESTLFTKDASKSYKTKTLNLIDVNDNKVYGTFNILTCEVQNTICKSEQEFRSMIRPFMED